MEWYKSGLSIGLTLSVNNSTKNLVRCVFSEIKILFTRTLYNVIYIRVFFYVWV